MARIDELLHRLMDTGGSDLHVAAGQPPRLRGRGELDPIQGIEPFDDGKVRELLREMVAEEQWREFEESGDLDFAYAIPGLARFRVNYLCQERGAAAVFRIIPEEISSVDDLGVPKAVADLAQLHQGLVLVTGPTGSGKSTTLAAIVDSINRGQARHIVTIEEPVEFVHKNRESLVSHREVGRHTESFGAALRAVVRQDADVVLVGEMRDRETIALALTAAEMGALVFGTLHTGGAAKTIDRVIDAFPADEQEQIRVSLSESLAAVVSQLLLPTADGKGRCAVYEILLRTQGLPNVIREGNIPMLGSIIQSGKGVGMQSMDDALFALVKEKRIHAADAYRAAREKQRFKPLLGAEAPAEA